MNAGLQLATLKCHIEMHVVVIEIHVVVIEIHVVVKIKIVLGSGALLILNLFVRIEVNIIVDVQNVTI